MRTFGMPVAGATPGEALQRAGLDWSVEQAPIYATRSQTFMGDAGMEVKDTVIAIPEKVANIRSDNAKVLGVVGAGFSVVQNRDMAALIYGAAEAEGIRMESAGAFRDGRIVYMQAHLDSFRIGKSDDMEMFALFANAHDGSMALTVCPTSFRVICQNTLRRAIGRANKGGLSVNLRHTINMSDRIEDVRNCLRGARKVAEEQKVGMEKLAQRKMTPTEIETFFTQVREKLYGPVTNEPKDASEKNRRTRAIEMTADWMGTLQREVAELGEAPSAWLAANAVTNWIDHRQTRRETKMGQDRMHSNILGAGARDKEEVFALAESL